MLSFIVAFSVVSASQPADAVGNHEAANALYKQLLDPGLLVGTEIRARLPVPTMPDGLDAAKQTAAIRALIGNDYSYEEFSRRSVVAPQLIKIRDVKPSDPQAPARGVDVWFIAYGDFKATDDEKFLDRLVSTGREGGNGGSGRALTKEELAKRNIVLPAGAEKHESYGHVAFDFLEKVRISATGRAVWTKTADSVVVAAEIDPRFRGDAELPNQWQAIANEGGQSKLGPANPWGGAGFYLKITKLAEPAGAVFLEQHIVFAEPAGWFNGANLLRSKLPLAVQINVRNMRKEWAKFEKPGQ